jgi:replication fork clamp-binding protein CrfC
VSILAFSIKSFLQELNKTGTSAIKNSFFMIFEFDIPIAIYLPKAKNNIKTLIINHLNNFYHFGTIHFVPF